MLLVSTGVGIRQARVQHCFCHMSTLVPSVESTNTWSGRGTPLGKCWQFCEPQFSHLKNGDRPSQLASWGCPEISKVFQSRCYME